MRISDWSSDVCSSDLIENHGVADVRLKWPNDLLADDRKLGGILIEHRGEAGGACRVVVGIGLNLPMVDNQASEVTQARSEERLVGKTGVRKGTSWGSPHS